MGSGLRGRCQGFDTKTGVSSHYPSIHSPQYQNPHSASFICALRRIASFTISRARFLLVLVLLSAVQCLPMPIFTSLNEIPGGLSCAVVLASTVRLTKSVGLILSYLSHDLVSEPCVKLFPIHFLAPESRQTHFSFTLCDCDFRIRTDEGPAFSALALMPNLLLREISKRLYHLFLHILKI
jgi:hypothetical protein